MRNSSSKQQEIVLVQRELKGARELWDKNLMPITKLTSLEREATRLEGERGQLTASVAQSKGKISELELQIIQIDRDLASEVGKDLREAEGKIGEFVERKVAAEDQLKRVDIRAPQDGTVHQSTAHTVGGVIAAGGEPIMLIVPDTDYAHGRGQGAASGHRPAAAGPASRSAFLHLQPAHDARAQRHGHPDIGGCNAGSAHGPQQLHHPHRLDAARRSPGSET